jgi:curved DNA-binding protein CbpA
MTKSLYAVLNVSPNADPAVIEAAYKALMKKYHPDILAGGPPGDQQKAAEINQAFQVLRDPERRARYDGDQRARQDAIRRATMEAASPRAYQPPSAPQARPRSRLPALLLLLGIAVAAWMWWREPDAVRDFFTPGMSALAAQTEESVPETQAIRVKDVDLALAEYRKIKSKTGLLGLSAFSEDCFAGQSRSASARALDYCVAFDHAVAIYGEKIAGDDLPQLPRFRPEQLDVRHESAARLVSDDQSWIDTRRAALRNLTFERLALAEPGTVQPVAPNQAAAAPPLPAAASATNPRQTQVRRHTARTARPVTQQAARAKRADRDFLEREGYIY